MTAQDLFAYQDTMLRATQDIHATFPGAEISVLWDDGKMSMVTGAHKVRAWNNLGSVEFQIEHNDILERGNAYKGFLALVAVQIGKKLAM